MGSIRKTAVLSWLALLWPSLSAAAFTFTNTIPTECDPLTVTWKGGQPPFRFLMIALDRVMYNFTIPLNSFNNNVGNFTIPQLMLSQFQRVMFTMSDGTGLSSGGITSLFTVGDSVGRVFCNTTNLNPDFFYSVDTDLKECKPYTFSLYPNAVQPVTIFGFIPNGPLLTLFPPLGDHYDFKNNLTAGTPIVFYMEDSLGRGGGTSDIEVVSLSDDNSCLSSTDAFNSTTTISRPPTATSTSTGPTDHSKSNNVAVIAGGAAAGGGAILFLCLLVGFWIWRRRRQTIESPLRTSIDPYQPEVYNWHVYSITEVDELKTPEKAGNLLSTAVPSARNSDPTTQNHARGGYSFLPALLPPVQEPTLPSPFLGTVLDTSSRPTPPQTSRRAIDAGPIPLDLDGSVDDDAETLPPEYEQLLDVRLP